MGYGIWSGSVMTSTNRIGEYGIEYAKILDEVIRNGDSDRRVSGDGAGMCKGRLGVSVSPFAATLTDTQTATLSPNAIGAAFRAIWDWITR